MLFPSSVTTNVIQTLSINGKNPQRNPIHVFFIGSRWFVTCANCVHEEVNPIAAHGARSVVTPLVYSVDEASTLGRRFSG